MTLHHEVLAMIEVGPQLVREVPLYDGPNVRIYETPEAFARRCVEFAVQKEREECAKVCSEVAKRSAKETPGAVRSALAIRRRGKP